MALRINPVEIYPHLSPLNKSPEENLHPSFNECPMPYSDPHF